MAKKKTQKTEQKGVVVSAKVNGGTFISEGATIEDALKGLPAIQAKTRASVTISVEGKESRPISLRIRDYNQLFYPGMTGDVSRTALVKKYTFYA